MPNGHLIQSLPGQLSRVSDFSYKLPLASEAAESRSVVRAGSCLWPSCADMC